jgi:hypothetical protein
VVVAEVVLRSTIRGGRHGLMTRGWSRIVVRNGRYRDEDRRKGNGWREANAKDSKDSGCTGLTVSSLAAGGERQLRGDHYAGGL